MHISRGNTPINNKDYLSREDALAAFLSPAYIGGRDGEISHWIDDAQFVSMGQVYRLEAGTNPLILSANASAARPAKFEPATAKQIALIRRLRVEGGSIGIRAQKAINGQLSRRETTRLIDDMFVEVRS